MIIDGAKVATLWAFCCKERELFSQVIWITARDPGIRGQACYSK
jgi:hypothetical protein